MSKHWTTDNIENQDGRVAIVTGANSGIGFETAAALADKGATVVLACRNPQKANAALAELEARNPAGLLHFIPLDLSDLDSVRTFAAEFRSRFDRLDLLINNAGVMMPPYSKTAQGYEMQFGVNHLGHFALTAHLIGLLDRTPGARVVNVSSVGHRLGRIKFDDLDSTKSYNKTLTYGQSKLANLLFTYELQRRLQAAGSAVIATAAHPGWTATELQRNAALFRFLNQFFAQTPADGALPTLRAAIDPALTGGEYFGPANWFELNGPPVQVKSNRRSHDKDVAARLWSVSEELVGTTFEVHTPSPVRAVA